MSDPGATLVVTTSHKARPQTRRDAVEYAERWSLDFVDRAEQPIEQLLESYDAALIITNNDKQLATATGLLKAHLGTAFIRLNSLSRNDPDPIVRAAELRPGDHVLDTTFGLGRDALVASCAVGPTGSVTALESSQALFLLGSHGLSDGPLAESELRSLFSLEPAPISLQCADAREYLRSADEDSVDVVFIDPMFSEPKTSDTGFSILRSLADGSALDQAWVEAAKRVARRWVVVKCGPSQPWFADVGLEPVQSHSNANWWRVSGST